MVYQQGCSCGSMGKSMGWQLGTVMLGCCMVFVKREVGVSVGLQKVVWPDIEDAIC